MKGKKNDRKNKENKKKGLKRRDFIKLAAAGGAAAFLGFNGNRVVAQKTKVIEHWNGTAAENPQTRKISEEIVESFNKANPGIEVKLEAISNSVIVEKLPAALKAGKAPLLISGAAGIGLRNAFGGKIVNLKPYFDDDPELTNDLLPAVKEAIVIPAGTKGLPEEGDFWWGAPTRGVANCWGGRLDILDQFGYAPEDLNNWSSVLEAAQIMTDVKKRRWGLGIYGTWWDLEQYWGFIKTFASYPGEDMFLERTENGWRSKLLNPRTKGATRFYVDLLKYFGVAHPDSPSLTDEDAAILLGKGEITMLSQIGGRRYTLNFPQLYEPGKEVITGWAWPKLTKALGQEYGDRYPELVDQEGFHGGHWWGHELNFFINKKKKNFYPDEAWKFIQHWLKPENVRKIALAYGGCTAPRMSVVKSIPDDPEFQPIAKAQAREILENPENVSSTGWPIPETFHIRWDLINGNVSKALAGEMSADEALEKADKEINDLLEKSGRLG